MAVYYCFQHDGYVDDDWHPMNEDGVCPSCVEWLEEEAQGEDYRTPRVAFSKSQRLFIQQMEQQADEG